ncbi:hypothetical protein [Hydrogenophaga pseudoflava]|uniref:hypothetical protein n=1 Tax=Hydrogenophaga pseudoflava TaxID=47421 RepID=UPI0027E553D6|nr:hypothetical protein [Hydrogenophaga pseudoflava]MDQ7745402.1 hypothetical protein [Hydrogenophaga pseudoflava]
MKLISKAICWWFGCSPIYEAEHHGSGTMPCERCGAPDTTYSDRVGDTRHLRMVERLRWVKWKLLESWRPKPCPACGKRGECADDCDGVPF